jgi:nucleoside-diphosphate-sugar epimerase
MAAAGEQTELAARRALVVGASGLLGTNFHQHLDSLGDWEVVTLSRKPVAAGSEARHLALDLLDRNACAQAAPALADVTHVFYLSRVVEPDSDYVIKVDPNVDMLKNLVDHLDPVATQLEHVQLMHGSKWYGSHLGPYRVPAKESHPRLVQALYYYGQHDYLAQKQRGRRWTWSTLRPHFVNGVAVGSPSNLMSALGAYAAVLNELGMPFSFPGLERTFDTLLMYSDVKLVCKAMTWAAIEPRCAGQDFNIANGDYFRWRDVWGGLAAHFGMAPGPAGRLNLKDFMSDKAPVWDKLVAKHDLRPTPFRQIADWAFADSVFRIEWDQALSVVKSHQFGFGEMVDSEQMLLEILSEYRRQRILP